MYNLFHVKGFVLSDLTTFVGNNGHIGRSF